MKVKLTLFVEKELIKKVKVLAVEKETSVSGLFEEYIKHLK